MQKLLSKKTWIINSSASKKKAALLCLIIYFLLALFYVNNGQEFIYNRLVNPMLFRLRNQTEYYSKLNPHLKIFAVDQKTMNEIQSEQMPIEEWTILFEALAKSHPKAIFIDKAFSLPLSRDPNVIHAFQNALHAAAPVNAGAIVAPIKFLTMNEFTPKQSFDQQLGSLKIFKAFAYGPRPEIIDSFAHLGHTNDDGDGYLKPLYRFSESQAIPHWGLNLGDGLSVQNGEIYFDKHHISVNENAALLVNMGPLLNYWMNTYSMIDLLKSARAGKTLVNIKNDDVVILLTTMYQGTTAYKATPAGSIPGGFVLAEVVNSALNGTWVTLIGGELAYLALACMIGCFLGWALAGFWIWPVLLLIESLLFLSGYYAFKFYTFHLPWAFPAIGVFFGGAVLFAEKSRLMAASAKVVQISLEGMVGPDKLKQLLNANGHFILEPQNQVLTILFIDIVGFSAAAEREPPQVVFSNLREILSLISEIVHEYGGITDRSLGDGLLCYFGYQYSKNEKEKFTHAEKALNCAIRIQKEILNRDIEAFKKGSHIFPIRIGVNTGEVYIGDLGGKNRIDFTIIGHAVNFAQRLEAGCQNYHILCGAVTRDHLMQKSQLSEKLIKKYIPVKNYSQLVESYELDPFAEEPILRESRHRLIRSKTKAERNRVRWPAKVGGLYLKLTEDSSEGGLFDFSLSGLGAKLEKYFGRGAILSFSIHSQDGELNKILTQNNLGNLLGEVRWAWPDSDGGFRTGILFKNFSPEQEALLLQNLRAFEKDETQSA